MGIVDGLITTANVLGSAVAIHSSVNYFAKQIPQKNDGFTYTYPVIVIEAEKTEAKVNEPIIFRGKVTIPGIIYIYSSDKLEATTYPQKDGKFYASFYFSKPGIYEIYAKIYKHESNSIYMTIK